MSALPRLLEDPAVSEKLRADLRRTQLHAVAPFDTAAGLERLRAGMKSGGGPVTPPGGGTVPGASWKLFAALGVAGVVGWMLLSGSSESRTQIGTARPGAQTPNAPLKTKLEVEKRTSDSSPKGAPPEGRPSVGVSSSPGSADVEPITAVVPLSAAPPVVERNSDTDLRARDSSERDTNDPLADEISHLGSLRELHQTDPAAAVISAREGHKMFAQGVLFEEREALLILSLSEVGQSAEALRRADAFRARFPRSAFLSKMQQLIPTSKQPPPATP